MVKPTNKELEHWKCAQQFPKSKESVYPEHTEAQEFDRWHDADVLEYGCGGGSDTISYLRRGNRVRFVDVVASNVECSRQRVAAAELSAGAEGVVLGSSDDFSAFADAMFDVVSSHGVLHHISTPLPVLQQMRRVIRPSGSLYVMLYTEHLYERCRTGIEGLIAGGMTGPEAFCYMTDGGACYARPYTEAEARELLSTAGFETTSLLEWNARDFRTYRAKPR